MTGLVVVSGPSGAGKSTLVAEVLRQRPEIWMSVSATTRAPRPGEVDGQDYSFVSATEFDRMVAAGELLEWARFAGNSYGTPRGPVEQRLQSGQTVLLEIELQGARQVRRTMPDCFAIFVAPPSVAELRRRLNLRATETDAAIAARLRVAEDELAAACEFDEVVHNEVFDTAVRELLILIDQV